MAEQTILIRPIQIKEQYALISDMMRGLHESEQGLFDKSDTWDNIAANYMNHVISMQEENEGVCLVAYIGEKAVGFIFGYAEEDDDSRIEVYKGIELYVSDGYVTPLYRKQGVYEKLNEALEKIYTDKGVRRITRFTLSSNTRMQHFLEKNGYVVTRLLYEKWLEPDGKTIQKLALEPPQ